MAYSTIILLIYLFVLVVYSQNPTSQAVDSYKDEVTKLEQEVNHLKQQLLTLQQGGEVSLLQEKEANSQIIEEHLKRISGK